MDLETLFKEAAVEAEADMVGFTDHHDKTVMILGYSWQNGQDLKTLDDRLQRLVRRLKAKGCSAQVISPVDEDSLSLRKLAQDAGVGFIGKSGLLITDKYGPRVRLAGIVTSAPLSFEKSPPTKNQCGSCTLCQDSCPSGAIEKRDPELCRKFRVGKEMETCSACIDACLIGR